MKRKKLDKDLILRQLNLIIKLLKILNSKHPCSSTYYYCKEFGSQCNKPECDRCE